MRTIKKRQHDGLSPDNSEIYAEFRSALSPARSVDEFKGRVLSIVNQLGFSDFLFVRIQRNWETASNAGLFYSVPDEYMRIYHESKMYQSDLMIPYVNTNSQPIYASQVYGYFNEAPFDIALMQENRMLQQLQKRFDYHDQFFIPMKACNGVGKVQLCMLHKRAAPKEFHALVTPLIPKLMCLCKAIDTVSTGRIRESFIGKDNDTVVISPKQVAVFSMMFNNDLTITELANLMCISPITAHQHISGGRKALGVSTNNAAIKKLIRLGLIEFE